MLKWTTTSEINSHHFEIQTSSDGKQFVHLATVAAAGNSSQTNHYSVEDPHPFNGNNFYRVITVDINEQKEFSNKIHVNFRPVDFYAGEVYSNPVVGMLSINLEAAKKQAVVISLYSPEGKKLGSEKISLDNNLVYTKDMNNMSAGRYTLRIVTETGMFVRSFIKL